MASFIPVLSLITLVAVIALGVITKKNCGIIGLLAAYLLALAANASGVTIKVSKIATANWPMSVFFIALSTTFLFAIANTNGTTAQLSKNIAFLAHGNTKLLPLAFFVGGAIISGIGAGGLVIAVIAPIALYIAVANDIPVMMMSLVTMGGIMVGGLSPLAINGVVAKELIAKEGIPGYTPFWAAYAVSMTIFSMLIYLFFGGLKIKNKQTSEKAEFAPFDRNQKCTLLAIVVVLVGVLCFKQDIGLMCFACAALLILFNCGDQKKTLAAIPWGTLLLICGMSVLIAVVKAVGGIEYLTTNLQTIMNEKNAQPIMVILGGLMGAVSSGTGVVMPTLIPLSTQLAQSIGTVSATYLIIGVIVGTNGVVISPLSTVGGLCVAGAPEGCDKDKLYNQLLAAAVAFIVLNAAASAIGLFRVFG